MSQWALEYCSCLDSRATEKVGAREKLRDKLRE